MDVMMGKRTVECFSKIFEYTDKREEAAETVVPDTMPDIDRILCARGTLVIRSKEASAGSITVTAGVAASVLYVPDDGGKVRCLSAAVPFSVTVDAPQVTPDSVPAAEMSIVSMDARMLNPRKVVVKVCAAICIAAYDRSKDEYSESISGDDAADIRLFTRTVTVNPVVCATEKTFVVSDEYRMPPGKPPVGEVLFSGAELCADEVKTVGTKLVVKGRARVSVVYIGAENDALQSAEFETVFSQLIESGCEMKSPDCSVAMLLTAVYIEPAALAGGEKGIICELHIVAQAVCSDQAEVTYISDCYSNRRALETVTRSANMCSGVRRGVYRGSLRDSIDTDSAASEVLFVTCTASEPTFSAGKAGCRVSATAVFADEAGQIRSCSRTFVLDCPVEVTEGRKAWTVSAVCAEASAVPTQKAVEVRLGVDFTVLECGEARISQISGITAGDPLQKELWPSITVIRAAPDASLWQIGKRYHSGSELIARANLLGDEDDIRGRVLLIPAEK